MATPSSADRLEMMAGHGIVDTRDLQAGYLPWWSLSLRQKTKGIWTGASAKLATVSAVVGTVTGIVGLVK